MPRRSSFRSSLTASVLLVTLALVATDTAFARRGGGDRVRERVALSMSAASPVAAAQTRIRIERRGLGRQEFRVKLERATPGANLFLWVEDAAGASVQLGAFREKRPGNYDYRVRTRKGQALPFGAADVAQLGGRQIEVRTAGGVLVASGTVPAASLATVGSAKKADERTRLAVDADLSQSVGTAGTRPVEARVRARRKDAGREELEFKIEGLASGLSLEIWMADAAGVMTFVATLPADDDDIGEYKREYETRDGDVLPFGASRIGDLARRRVEFRLADGSILAEGSVPDVGVAASGKSDDKSGSGKGGGDDDDSDHDSDDDDHGDDDDLGGGHGSDDGPDDDEDDHGPNHQ